MLMLPAERLMNGVLLFPDSDDAGRYYLHPAELTILRLDLETRENAPRWFACDVELAAIGNAQLTQQHRVGVRDILPVPWDVGVVKLWGTWGGRPRLISEGSNSGLSTQKSVHQGALEFDPSEIYLTTELCCQARIQGEINKIAWAGPTGELVKSLVADANRMLDLAWRERELTTVGEVFIHLVTEQERLGWLCIDVDGIDSEELREQLHIQIAHDLFTVLLGPGYSFFDLIAEKIVISDKAFHLPQPPYIGQSIKYRILLKQHLGHVAGSCKYKVAPGFNWNDFITVRVFADAQERGLIKKQAMQPWKSFVLTRSRSEVEDNGPCGGNVWAEADHRDYPYPLLLPRPEFMNGMVLIDAPQLQEGELTIQFENNWPGKLFPCEVVVLSSAWHLEPSDGRIRVSSSQEKSHYRGLRWLDTDEDEVLVHISYSLQKNMWGYAKAKLKWDEVNTISSSLLPHIRLEVQKDASKLTAVVEVAQGRAGPNAKYQQFSVHGPCVEDVFLDSLAGPGWYRIMYFDTANEEIASTQWRNVQEQRISVEWPKKIEVKLSSAPDLKAQTRLWVTSSPATIDQAQMVELTPFGCLVSLFSFLEEAVDYYIALASMEDTEPPAWESGRWHKETRKKIRVNQLYIDKLRAAEMA